MKKIILILLAGLAATQVIAGTTDNLLKIYAVVTDKTVLRGTLPELPAAIISRIPKDKTNAVIFIENQLKTNQFDVVRDGVKFVMILPAGWQKSPLAKELDQLELESPTINEAIPPRIPTGLIPPGTIYFQGLRLNMFLEVYSKLRGRTIVRPSPLPDIFINLQTQTPLTKNELIHAFEIVLLLNGIATIDDGDKFVKVVPAKSAERTR
jgi:hypothetical protein